ncbi:double-stranded RNA-specific editase 1 isoform X2 [Eurosta solidaginis]|uniref:double-stranded RNA-specific editase 1 isoform X2 n=1 Tax=Eurosta solidaginis TaxID=178769 RepID=UPI00353066F1
MKDARQQQSGFSGNQLGTPVSNQGIAGNQVTPSTPRNPNYRNKISQDEQNTNGQGALQHQQRNGKQQTAPLQPPPLPPQMDDEPQVTPTQESTDVKMEETNLYDESGKLQYKNIFRTRKKSSVRTKEKRIRVNRQLRKTLIPKNALMALHEVNGLNIGEFVVDNSPSGGFVAVVTVNEKQYEGKGNSKTAAKNNASEKALRDYILEKMKENPRPRKHTANAGEAMDTGEDNNTGNGEHDDATGIIDDVPMANLASFAIYKLFVEWENEGYPVPELRIEHTPNSEADSVESSPQVKTPKPPTNRSELPTNWESIHPSTLLCMMRPGLQYRELGTVGERPNTLQRMSVTVDNVEYASSGRSKKIARRNVAVTVLNALFGTNFTKDGPFEE